jgi:nucleotide-binding universal stress UspA family protein
MKISKVLIAYDGSNCADAAIEDLCRSGLPERAYAIVMSVIEDWLCEPLSIEHLESLAQRASARINSLMPGWSVEPLVSFGSAAGIIIDKADEWRPDLIIAGSHGRSAAGRAFFGSVSQKLAHDAHCTVRVSRCHPVEPGAPVRLVVGVDGSKGAEAAIGAVAERQWPRGAEARVVNSSWKIPIAPSEMALSHFVERDACENGGAERMVEAAAEKLQTAGLATSVAMEEEEPERLLLSEAENRGGGFDLRGLHAQGGLARGRTSDGDLRKRSAHCNFSGPVAAC